MITGVSCRCSKTVGELHATYLDLVLSSTMSGIVPPLPNILSWFAEESFTFTCAENQKLFTLQKFYGKFAYGCYGEENV